jgi:hypothetical protein
MEINPDDFPFRSRSFMMINENNIYGHHELLVDEMTR